MIISSINFYSIIKLKILQEIKENEYQCEHRRNRLYEHLKRHDRKKKLAIILFKNEIRIRLQHFNLCIVSISRKNKKYHGICYIYVCYIYIYLLDII